MVDANGQSLAYVYSRQTRNKPEWGSMRLSIILLALTLAGCATQQHHAENAAATRAALAAADEAKCAGQGLRKDTNPFAECMLQLEQARQSQQATDEAAPIALTPPPVH